MRFHRPERQSQNLRGLAMSEFLAETKRKRGALIFRQVFHRLAKSQALSGAFRRFVRLRVAQIRVGRFARFAAGLRTARTAPVLERHTAYECAQRGRSVEAM